MLIKYINQRAAKERLSVGDFIYVSESALNNGDNFGAVASGTVKALTATSVILTYRETDKEELVEIPIEHLILYHPKGEVDDTPGDWVLVNDSTICYRRQMPSENGATVFEFVKVKQFGTNLFRVANGTVIPADESEVIREDDESDEDFAKRIFEIFDTEYDINRRYDSIEEAMEDVISIMGKNERVENAEGIYNRILFGINSGLYDFCQPYFLRELRIYVAKKGSVKLTQAHLIAKKACAKYASATAHDYMEALRYTDELLDMLQEFDLCGLHQNAEVRLSDENGCCDSCKRWDHQLSPSHKQPSVSKLFLVNIGETQSKLCLDCLEFLMEQIENVIHD